ncbi:uncharacterized protein BDZ99DRAFT_474377 [Mytilinidion resinicola]|uniref:Uncharacterized protein n=1 Tax=Mytilinidion resinicola TaxID=574789 RepID=A0A6A6YUF6_9PEZI|nr:uncharacterized protein BDZ99DRAFT_474377 [Mytilinidion resinicola]KAF2812159.1 hypothetical protein BDZ99DRAFT_474377 [Mytilinidion resinicola]
MSDQAYPYGSAPVISSSELPPSYYAASRGSTLEATLEQYHASNPAYSQHQSSAGATNTKNTPAEESVIEASDEEIVAQKLSWLPPRPNTPLSHMPLLAKPVAIPQVDIPRLGRPMPFTRAYSYALQSHHVQLEHFVAFIDALAIAQAAPAPLQALNVVGQGIGFVPHHWAQAASAGIGLAAGAGTAAVTITRTKMFMERVNKEYFGPRALKASLVSDEELAALVGYPANAPTLSPLDLNSDATTIRERRLQALAPHVSPLTFEVPPPAAPTNVLDKLSARQIQATIAKNQKKAAKDRRKSNSSSRSSSSDSSDSGKATRNDKIERKLYTLELEIQQIDLKAQKKTLGKGPKKAGEIEEDRRKEIAKAEKKRKKLLRQYEKKQSKTNGYGDGTVDQAYQAYQAYHTPKPKQSKKQQEKDEKASKKTKKLKWIVVTDLRS